MTGLEALKEIFNIIYNLDCGTTFEQDKKLNECRDVLKRVIFNSEKSLKALEIIKEKNVDIKLLKASSTVEQYNNELIRVLGRWFAEREFLTQEEFDTLKEVLE